MKCLRWMLCGVAAALFVGSGTFPLSAVAQPPAQGTGSAPHDPFGGSPRSQPDPFGAPGGDPNDPFAAPQQGQTDPFGTAADKPVTIYVPSSSNKEVEQQIERALHNKTSVAFIETPLHQCVEKLAEDHKIPILIDLRAMEEIGLSREVSVTLNVKNISLRSCLRLMLSKLDLTYIIQDEVLQVTTLEKAEQQLSTVVYRLDSIGLKANDARQLISRTIDSDTWETLGGPSSIQAMSSEDDKHHLLVVSTTRKTHEQIAELLQRLGTEKVGGLQLLPPAGVGDVYPEPGYVPAPGPHSRPAEVPESGFGSF